MRLRPHREDAALHEHHAVEQGVHGAQLRRGDGVAPVHAHALNDFVLHQCRAFAFGLPVHVLPHTQHAARHQQQAAHGPRHLAARVALLPQFRVVVAQYFLDGLGVVLQVAHWGAFAHGGHDALAYHEVHRDAERLAKTYLRVLQGRGHVLDVLGQVVGLAAVFAVGVYGYDVLLEFQCHFYFAAHPVALVHAAVERPLRHDEDKDGCLRYGLFNLFAENAVFQFVVVQKYGVTALLQHHLQNAGILCAAIASVTDEDVVLRFHVSKKKW